MDTAAVIKLLRAECAGFNFEPIAIYKEHGEHPWPLVANDHVDLAEQLAAGDHFLPLPKEPAALANIVEVAIVDFLLDRLGGKAKVTRGRERVYPDLELEAGGKVFAVDVKVARRKVNAKGVPTGKTDSRITLYTGNTFFLYPEIKWPGILRPFAEYEAHIDLLGLYTLDLESPTRVRDFELLVVEAWKIGSKRRSSTTREYLGAVDDIEKLRNEQGEFASADEFYKFWRAHDWKIGKAVKKKLQALLAAGSKG